VVGCLLWLPFVQLLAISLIAIRRVGTAGQAARAYVALVPAIVLTGLTGWGWLQSPQLELLCLVSGYVAGTIRPTVDPVWAPLNKLEEPGNELEEISTHG
jgi:hypothetical protein